MVKCNSYFISGEKLINDLSLAPLLSEASFNALQPARDDLATNAVLWFSRTG